MKAFRIILVTVQCYGTLQKTCVVAKVIIPKPANKILLSLITPVRRGCSGTTSKATRGSLTSFAG